VQDNDPKHSSWVAKDFHHAKWIKWWQTPASSADINPIERVWREMKYFIARHVKPLTKKRTGGWDFPVLETEMTQEKCANYIQHTFKVLPKIVGKNGGITGD
jgi:hypothetical protein